MKNYFATFSLLCALFLAAGCGEKSISDNEPEQMEFTIDKVITKANGACNSAAPEQSLQWLSDIIKKAEEDRLAKKYMGRYLGKIFLTSYKNQPIFYVRMGMDSMYAQTYDCSGNSVIIPQSDVVDVFQKAEQGTLIYSHMP